MNNLKILPKADFIRLVYILMNMLFYVSDERQISVLKRAADVPDYQNRFGVCLNNQTNFIVQHNCFCFKKLLDFQLDVYHPIRKYVN